MQTWFAGGLSAVYVWGSSTAASFCCGNSLYFSNVFVWGFLLGWLFFKKDALIFREVTQPQLHWEVQAREAYAMKIPVNWSC